ncbi:cupin domain-containing protein [Variovorax sp. RKNM96]|uniref:cupin domain-containing protein n=1 Tax=Variovorax sp. RKNM96 TaxID=2681552 RepID=UPI00197FB76B|nr:cupin domain-containing protein [Variovorax sp. RKNM96]
MDWLSRFLGMIPVSGRLELRCLYGAPWRVVYEPSPAGEMPYHVVLSGSAVIESPDGGAPHELSAGDIVLMTHGSAHVLHDGSGAKPGRVKKRENLSVVVSENSGRGERLDMLCGRFVLAPHHERLVRDYLPSTLVIRGAADTTEAQRATHAQVTRLVEMMRTESTADALGGLAMLNALSAALFTVALRLAGESEDAPVGLLALAGHPRLAPALAAMLDDPAHPWTLPELARLCHMSRATMARHFQDRVGRSASDLLTDIRIGLAINELQNPSSSTEAVAEKVGYQSVGAFRLAFKKRMGTSPADWRRTAARANIAEG